MNAPTPKQVTVFVGLVVKDNKILLVKRNEPEVPDAHLKWEFPGGKVGFGETPEQAVIRELKEETGVTVKIKRLLPCVVTTIWNYKWGKQQTIILGFECMLLSEGKRNYDHHVKAIEWVPIEEVLMRETLPGAEPFLEALRS